MDTLCFEQSSIPYIYTFAHVLYSYVIYFLVYVNGGEYGQKKSLNEDGRKVELQYQEAVKCFRK